MLSLFFHMASSSFNLPDGLINSVCWVESRHNVGAIHHHDGNGDSIGLCQIKLSTARGVGFTGTADQLMDPMVNTYYAAAYLRHQIDRYKDVTAGLVAYNQGSIKESTSTSYSDSVKREWRIYVENTRPQPECCYRLPSNSKKILRVASAESRGHKVRRKEARLKSIKSYCYGKGRPGDDLRPSEVRCRQLAKGTSVDEILGGFAAAHICLPGRRRQGS